MNLTSSFKTKSSTILKQAKMSSLRKGGVNGGKW